MRCRRTVPHPSINRKTNMFKKSSGQQPPRELAAALAKFETAQHEQLARGVAAHAAMPHNLTKQQRAAVMTMARRLNPSR